MKKKENRKKFNNKKSTTYKPINKTFSIKYVDDAEVQGLLGTERITVGDFKIDNQPFGQVTYLSCKFE